MRGDASNGQWTPGLLVQTLYTFTRNAYAAGETQHPATGKTIVLDAPPLTDNETTTGARRLDEMPMDVLEMVLCYLDLGDVLSVSAVCKYA